MANEQGNAASLIASHPENKNAMKSGVHSPRRRAEAAATIAAALQADPEGYLRADEFVRFAMLRGYLDLMAADVAEKGVSDRHGNPRRTAEAFPRVVRQVQDLAGKLQADHRWRDELGQGPFTKDEGLSLLRQIAHDESIAAGHRIAAITILLPPDGTAGTGRGSDAGIDEISDEEIERQLDAWLHPLSTGESNA